MMREELGVRNGNWEEDEGGARMRNGNKEEDEGGARSEKWELGRG